MPLTDMESTMLSLVNVKGMWKHVEYLCSFDKTSGTEGEHRAVEYIVEALKSYGVDVNVHVFNAYLSYPVSAQLNVDGLGEIAAKTRSFSESTPQAGVSGEIVYVPGGADMFTDTETVERLRGMDLSGKIVLSEGGGRENMLLARRLGAVGYIHMWPSDEDVIHEGIVTPVWGTPTPETVDSLPRIPVISIKKNDGLAIRFLLDERPVNARLNTTVVTGWRRVMLPEALIAGQTSEYVLIGGHLDSWHLGATDNVTGNVTLLELAKIFKSYQNALRRGVRIAWWPGHSTGRYAGSTWYCDRFWQDLHDNCVTYINIDSPGVLGAYDYSIVTSVAENDSFAAEVVKEITGQTPEPERPSRAGDQSFWGPGVSSLFMLLSNRLPGQRAQVGGSGMGWWWHTEQDTIDKIEPAVLEKDCKIYILATSRLCTMDLLPLDVHAQANEIKVEIENIARAAGTAFDMTPSLEASARLAAEARAFQLKMETASGANRRAQLNTLALRAVKAMTSVQYSPVEPTEHGQAIPTKPVPMLQPATRLPRMNPVSDEYRFALVALSRGQNSVVARLRAATRHLRSAGE